MLARSVRHLVPAVLATGLLLSTAACSDTDSPAATNSSSTSDPTATSTPSVAPATGPRITMTSLSLRIPEGWKKSSIIATLNQSGTDHKTGNSVGVSNPPDFSGSTSLSRQAKDQVRNLRLGSSSFEGSVTMLDPVTIAGVPMYHFTYRGSLGLKADYTGDVYGAALPHENKVNVDFHWRDQAHLTEAERDEIKESVFASIRWKGFTP